MTAVRSLEQAHHDGGPLSVATQSPDLGDRVEVRVRVPAGPDGSGVPDTVHLRSLEDADPVYDRLRRDGTDALGQAVFVGEVTVRHPCTRYRFLLEGGRAGYAWLTQEGLVGHDVTDGTDFRLLAHPGPPDWVADQWFYQLFPDRFARSGRVDRSVFPDWAAPAAWDDPPASTFPASMHQLYGGDLWGVAERLDHLERLGVTAAYLNPIFPAQQNHRYCATSFDHVDPVLGGDEALAALTAAMHDRGMRLVGDLTANHSGSHHPWFAAARAGQQPERGMYCFTDWPDEYEAWAGVPTLPKFDHRSAALRERLYEGEDAPVRRWLRDPVALDGWRVDAANMTGRARDVDVNAEVAASLLRVVREERGDDAWLLAEHCHDAGRDLERPGWHGTMNYPGSARPVWTWLRTEEPIDPFYIGWDVPLPRVDAATAVTSLVAANARLPWRAVTASLTLLGSHDTARWRSVAGDRGRALVGFGLLATLPGVPSMLYGDEWGLEGLTEDEARVPMPWHDPSRQDGATFEAVRRLVALRRESVALRRGGLRWAGSLGPDALAFVRDHPHERVLVVASRAAHGPLALPGGGHVAAPGVPLLDHDELAPATDPTTVVVPAADAPRIAVWRVA